VRGRLETRPTASQPAIPQGQNQIRDSRRAELRGTQARRGATAGVAQGRRTRGADRSYTRCRWVLSEDHPDTLGSAGNLAADLRDLGEFVTSPK
jgi:hypothetical protein